MEPIPPPPPHSTTLADILLQCGFVGPFLLFAAAILLAWSLVLFFTARPIAEYYVFIAATLWPLLLGIFGSAWCCIGALKAEMDKGIENPNQLLYLHLSEVLNPLLFGSLLTCVFFPIGIALLVFRKPR